MGRDVTLQIKVIDRSSNPAYNANPYVFPRLDFFRAYLSFTRAHESVALTGNESLRFPAICNYKVHGSRSLTSGFRA